MKTNIVLGLGFGDEGKGITTDFLCRHSSNPLVVRHSGGHQAGHTVVTEKGERHVFSSFGSGTMQGVPTYWSKFCTFYPIAFWNELQALLKRGFRPKIYVDALAPVTTPYDAFYNQTTEQINAHGSCGVGFGATIERNESPYKLYVQDLLYPRVLEQKMKAIHQYYLQKLGGPLSNPVLEEALLFFHGVLEEVVSAIDIVQEKTFFQTSKEKQSYDQIIFEGSQGILLDMDYGFFPNVTRCHTTSKNALTIIQDNHLTNPAIYYITRAYQTRHGNGFLSNEGLALNFLPNPNETNQYNRWQGSQRCSVLDLDLINYALQCDSNYSGNLSKNLVITCLDQIEGNIRATENGISKEYDNPLVLLDKLNCSFENVVESHSDCSLNMYMRSLHDNFVF